MNFSQRERKWRSNRYFTLPLQSALGLEGKKSLLDSREPKEDFRKFLMSEVRFRALTNEFPERAEELFAKAEAEAKERLKRYQKLAEG